MDGERKQLYINLQRIEDEQYRLREGEKLWDYITLMLQYIGDPEPELRDELIYPTFHEWIVVKRWFNKAELLNMLSVLIGDQHLFYGIGGKEDESVFTRSFSVLVIALLLQRHREQSFMDLSCFKRLQDSLVRYYEGEKDLRGYLAEGGWAHCAAHGADALRELVQCEESDEAGRNEVLTAVKGMLYNGYYSFQDEEDERIASIVDVIISRKLLPYPSIAEWLIGLGECGSRPKSRSQTISRVNAKDCLRSLYFRLLHNSRGQDLLPVILKTESELNRFA
ncbi:Protein of unknown function [Paenibacillus sophorae]|uniref:DUF2785 domain-containing protein n=1 Tax=Paenibacillus sophorae TaxID=1333845 RepID=A0A1H8U5H9_9BACL|nr:DUF2785 domain-containing protein [Paenibacillus sophorae]QWU18322.1 DUF2785 domain-containing protein [Paenibacillus sophorae]SEO98094.1 Protein of unknown function [Paenibacillus sophorae]